MCFMFVCFFSTYKNRKLFEHIQHKPSTEFWHVAQWTVAHAGLNTATPTITDRRMSTDPSFPSESVHTLFFGKTTGCEKNGPQMRLG